MADFTNTNMYQQFRDAFAPKSPYFKVNASAPTIELMQSSSAEFQPVLLVGPRNRQRIGLEEVLNRAGYRVTTVASAQEAIRLFHCWENSGLVLVMRAPDMTPVELCQQMRSRLDHEQDARIVFVASQFDADQAVEWLKAGADDYISGPYLEEKRVLLARLEAAVRTCRFHAANGQGESNGLMRFGDLVIDPSKYRVYVEGQPCDLTRIQFHLLCSFARRPGLVLSHSQLRGMIAKYGGNPDEKSIKSHIHNLRRRLGPAGRKIRTVRGVGYQLRE
jgi:two-component system phosphate regulon response regulator PhoB